MTERFATQHPVSDHVASLPPYSGEEARCVKCGNEGASTQYMPEADTIDSYEEALGAVAWTRYEFLLRTCLRCGYGWPEAVLPAHKAPVARCPEIGKFDPRKRCTQQAGHEGAHRFVNGLACKVVRFGNRCINHHGHSEDHYDGLNSWTNCARCKSTGIDPEDSYGGEGPSEYSLGEPPVLEPCRDCGH